MVWDSSRNNFARNLAVVIGIDRYDNHPGIHNLSTAVNDARVIADLLQTHYGYKEENIIRLLSPRPEDVTLKNLKQPYHEATLDNLKTLLVEDLPRKLKPTDGDRLLFYFAGHGIPQESKDGPAGYLIPQTAELGNLETYLPMRELHDALKQLSCHHLLIILDCCFGGMFRWASSRKLISVLETVHREHYDRFIRYPAWQVITSAAHNEEALDLSIDHRKSEENSHHSPFAQALIEGLTPNDKGKTIADFIPDGVVTAHELFLHLNDQVSELSKSRQTPGIYPMRLEYDKGEFVFVSPDFNPLDPDPTKGLKYAPLLNEENNPYRGLKPFDERHSSFFFGRNALIQELDGCFAKPGRSLTIVLGASGSGKSSLVKAGLIPYLRKKQNSEQQSPKWYILNPMRPGKSPFEELARAILPIAEPGLIERLNPIKAIDQVFEQTKQTSDLVKNKEQSEDDLQLAFNWNSANAEAKLLLLIDYFEQLSKVYPAAELKALRDDIKTNIDQLALELQNNPQYLTNKISTWSQTNQKTKILLVIDQFEELVTMAQEHQKVTQPACSNNQNGDKEAQQFLKTLRIALASHRHRMHLVLTLRSDFEPRFLNSPLKSHWRRGRFPVRAMNSEELWQAIEGPALKQALVFNPENLVSKLIDEVGQMPGALPLLSFTLSELYIKLYQRWIHGTDRSLTLDDYITLGGVAGSLTRRATEEYDKLVKDKDTNDEYQGGFGAKNGEAYQATMRRLLLRMVAIEGGSVARRRVPISELEYSSYDENERVGTVIERLVKARLIVKGQESEAPYIEPSHDFLVRGWDKLQEWIKQEQANLLLQRELTPTAYKWKSVEQESRSSGLLWDDDPRLSSTVALMLKAGYKDSWLNFFKWLLMRNHYKSQSNSFWLNSIETKFIQNSFDRRFEKRRNLIGITGVVVASLFTLTIATFIQAQEAIAGRNSTQQELESVRALRQFEVDQNIAPLVSIIRTASRLDQWRRENHDPLLQSYRTVTPLFALQSILDNIHEKNEFFAAKNDAIWQIFGEQVYPQERGLPEVFAKNANGNILAIRQNDGVVFKDMSTNTEVGRFSPTDSFVNAVAFSPDSQFIAVLHVFGGGEGPQILSLLKFNRGTSLSLLSNITGPRRLGKIAFTDDNQYLATGALPEGNGGFVRFWSLQPRLLIKADDQQAFTSAEDQYLCNLRKEAIGGKIKVFDENDQQIAEFIGEATWFQQIFLNSQEQQIISLGEDGKIRLWNTSGDLLKTIEGHQSQIRRIVLSLDRNHLATLGDIGIVITSIKSGKRIGTITGSQNQFSRISFSPDGQRIATLGLERTVRIWDLRGRQLAELSLTNPQIAQIMGGRRAGGLDMGDGWEPDVKFTPDGKYLVIFSNGRNTANPTLFWKVENLDDLLKRGCQWLSDYLQNPSTSESDKQLCLDIPSNR